MKKSTRAYALPQAELPISEGAQRGGDGEMFNRIAHRYDLLNRVNSLGLDQSWRRRMVRSLELSEEHRVLDLATGTADVALMMAPKVKEVVGLDPSAGMLAVGRDKAAAAKLDGKVKLVEGDAQALPFEDASFDAVTMAFGIRNVPDRDRALREIARVLRPGGRAAILELSVPSKGFMSVMARLHMRVVVPVVGAALSAGAAYRYLKDSIEAFDTPESFAARLQAAGLSEVEIEPMSFSASHLYIGRKS